MAHFSQEIRQLNLRNKPVVEDKMNKLGGGPEGGTENWGKRDQQNATIRNVPIRGGNWGGDTGGGKLGVRGQKNRQGQITKATTQMRGQGVLGPPSRARKRGGCSREQKSRKKGLHVNHEIEAGGKVEWERRRNIEQQAWGAKVSTKKRRTQGINNLLKGVVIRKPARR